MGIGDKSVEVFLYFYSPKALAAVYDFVEVNIIFNEDMHRYTSFWYGTMWFADCGKWLRGNAFDKVAR
jgi:hypothetical protein